MSGFRAGRWLAIAIVVALAIPPMTFAQGRTLQTIVKKGAPGPQKAAPAPGLCVAAVHHIAAAWADANLEEVLSADFPNRTQLIDAIRRASLRATNVALVVESVPTTRYSPVVARDGRQVTDCVADVVTRVIWDDPVTGARQRGAEGRGQWRIEIVMAAPAGGTR